MSSGSMRAYLEYQADRVEAVLDVHGVPARVVGGNKGKWVIQFYLQPSPHITFSQIERRADDIAAAMRLNSIKIHRDTQGVVVTFPNPYATDPSLVGLLRECRAPKQVVLGETESCQPLIAQIDSRDAYHAIIESQASLDVLMSISVSLLVNGKCQIIFLSDREAFAPFQNCQNAIMADKGDGVPRMSALQRIVEQRMQGVYYNRGDIIMIIDSPQDLLESTVWLNWLLERAYPHGVHLVATSPTPLPQFNFPLRITDAVTTPQEHAFIANTRTLPHKLTAHCASEQTGFYPPSTSTSDIATILVNHH